MTDARWSIRAAQLDDRAAWARARAALWPEEDATTLSDEIPAILADAARLGSFVALDARGELIGFAEAALRRDHVNGTQSSPVGFLEGWYVAPGWRRRGIGCALVEAVAQWARSRGCRELASDALLDNALSHAAHAAAGFAETERVVYFRRQL